MATEYFVEPLWPKRRFNLIFGPSGAGKTYWLMPQLYALMNGEPIMGKPTKPVKVAYVCCDRTAEDADETIEKLGLDPRQLPKMSFMDNELTLGMGSITDWMPKGTELLVIEAIAGLLPGNNQNKISDYGSVMQFGRAINRMMRNTGAGCWGTTHSPKTKEGEQFLHTRDNALGSSLWGGIAGTMIEIQYNDKTQQRIITTMLRHDPPYTENYEFNEHNHLVIVENEAANFLMNKWLASIAASESITTAMIVDRAQEFKFSESTAKRWLAVMEKEGRLFKTQKGLYVVRAKQ